MAESPYTLQWAAPFFLKIAPSHGDLDRHLIHGSLAPRVHNPNGMLIGSAVFACLMIVTDRPTEDRPWYSSVTIGHICIRSTVMRPSE